MYSCNKNELNEQTKDYEDGTALAEQILAFKANMINKSGENMPLADALENMELLINASHGFPFEEYGERQNDVVSFQLQADENGNVTMAEVNAAYAEMINQVRQAYINTGFADKGLILVTLSINEEDKSGSTIDVNVTTGKVGEPDSDNFTNCWYYGENMGQCTGTQYEGIMDGGDTIANTIAANNPLYDWCDHPGPGWRLILEFQDPITLEGNEYQDVQGDNLMFFYPDEEGDYFTDEEMQLQSEDMNYYYDNEYELIYEIIPQEYNYPFATYVLVNCIINGEPWTYNQGGIDNTALRHQNVLTYAHRYWVQVSIIDNPLPIDL
ncbi:MAG: hypothetical protein K8R54_03025 [Bacteroidales bacterium]|nr:hypothetical protein [Bacteroidales bacterium]